MWPMILQLEQEHVKERNFFPIKLWKFLANKHKNPLIELYTLRVVMEMILKIFDFDFSPEFKYGRLRSTYVPS